MLPGSERTDKASIAPHQNFLRKIRGGHSVASEITVGLDAVDLSDVKKLHTQVKQLGSERKIAEFVSRRVFSDLVEGEVEVVGQFVMSRTELLLLVMSRSYAC